MGGTAWALIGAVAVIGLIVLVVILYAAGVYNRLVTLKERYRNAFSQIEVQLKRRYDLIPNLVEICKKYLSHERETLEAVIAARNQASALLNAAADNPGVAQAMAGLANAEGALKGAMMNLNAVMERYPDLKGNEETGRLTEELTSTENRIAFARQAFNDAVTSYNIYKKTFPPVVIAGMFGHAQDAALLEYEDRAEMQAAPKVSFE